MPDCSSEESPAQDLGKLVNKSRFCMTNTRLPYTFTFQKVPFKTSFNILNEGVPFCFSTMKGFDIFVYIL